MTLLHNKPSLYRNPSIDRHLIWRSRFDRSAILVQSQFDQSIEQDKPSCSARPSSAPKPSPVCSVLALPPGLARSCAFQHSIFASLNSQLLYLRLPSAKPRTKSLTRSLLLPCPPRKLKLTSRQHPQCRLLPNIPAPLIVIPHALADALDRIVLLDVPHRRTIDPVSGGTGRRRGGRRRVLCAHRV